VVVGVKVGVAHADLLVGAAGAGKFTTVDAGVVEVGVEGAEVATAAEPQSRHRDIGRRWLTGGMDWWNGWQLCWIAGGYKRGD
jgi:hypothetical protein